MSTAKRVVKNTAFLYVRMIVSILTNFFTTRILLDALGASDFGLYNVVGGAITMLGFLTTSMSHTTQRFLNYVEGQGNFERIKQVFNNSLIIHYFLAIVFVIILLIASLFYFNGVLNIPEGRFYAALWVYACLIFSTTFSVIIVPYDSVLNAHENMKVYSIIGICDVIFKLLVSIIVLYLDSDRLILYAILMAIESWVVRSITKGYCKRNYPECSREEIRKYYNRNTIKDIASFAGWNLANIGAGMTSLYGRNILINHFFGTILNAALGIATQLSGVMMAVSSNMLKALTPILVKSEASNQREKMLEITYIGCRFSFLLFSFCCIPIFFYINDILILWLRNVPTNTEIFCKILIIATLIEQLFSFIYQTIAAEGNIKTYNITRSCINIMPLISTFLCFHMGLDAHWAIVNWLIWYSIVGGIVNIYFGKINAGLIIKKFLQSTILPCLLVTILSIILNIIIKNISNNIGIHFLISILISCFFSIPIYWLIGLNKLEKKKFMNILFNK